MKGGGCFFNFLLFLLQNNIDIYVNRIMRPSIQKYWQPQNYRYYKIDVLVAVIRSCSFCSVLFLHIFSFELRSVYATISTYKLYSSSSTAIYYVGCSCFMLFVIFCAYGCPTQFLYLMVFMSFKNYCITTGDTSGAGSTVKPVLRDHPWEKEKMALKDRWPLKRGSINMKFSMTRQEKGDLLIQVTA